MKATPPMQALAVLALERRSVPARTAVRIIHEVRTEEKNIASLLKEAIGEVAMLKAIAAEIGMEFYDLGRGNELRFDDELIRQCNVQTLRDHGALPMRDQDDNVVVVVRMETLDLTGYLSTCFPDGYRLMLGSTEQIDANLSRAAAADFDAKLEDLTPAPEEKKKVAAVPTGPRNPLVDWVEGLLKRAVVERASDVHLNLFSDGSLNLRFRIDGVLIPQQVPVALRTPRRALEILATLMNKCTGFDATNVLVPQDGAFSFEVEDRQIDVRLAMLPQINGPSVIMRILDSSSVKTRIDDMGFSEENLELMRHHIQASQGTIVCVGPTGSGKTTTLYALLRELDPATNNIITVENPVEYRIEGVNQTPIREDLGERSVTFSRALRTILRSDPDVILVGEIRDTEVASVAMEAAITGHLVLTTLHTNSALGVFPRLSQMGVPPHMSAEAVSLVISQRLVRRVHDCAIWEEPEEDERMILERVGAGDVERVRHPVGCGGCRNLGYRGRIAVAELLEPNTEIRALAEDRAPATAIERAAREAGFVSISEDALRHVRAGHTTVREAARILTAAPGEV